jgi:hypothetical protein
MNASAQRGLALAAVAAAALGAAGCASNGAAEKSGAAGDKQVILTLQMPDLGDRLGTFFTKAVERRAGGSIRLKIAGGYSRAVAANAAEESAELSQLCRAGIRIGVPTARQLQQLAATARPSIAPLMKDPRAAQVLAAMARIPGALATPLPGACTGARPPADQRAGAKFPEGTYVATVTPAMFAASGAQKQKFLQTWTLTTRFRDGRWSQLVKPEFPDECPTKARPSFPPCGGTYKVDGDELTLNWARPPGAPETMRWSYFDGVLRFEPVDVADQAERAIIGQPWRKVG